MPDPQKKISSNLVWVWVCPVCGREFREGTINPEDHMLGVHPNYPDSPSN